jgi:16S rRNA (cytidine1402-2'-O)-methyltransferase
MSWNFGFVEEKMGQTSTERGSLTLVGTPIGNLGDLSPRAAEALVAADVILAEDTRVSLKLLRHVGAHPAQLLPLRGPHALSPSTLHGLIEDGQRVVVVSDAGMPSISDPGNELIDEVLEVGAAISVVPGPSASVAIASLANFDVSTFVFVGFLPSRSGKRRQRLNELRSHGLPLIIFEAPHRIQECLADLVDVIGADRRAVVGRELTKRYEEIRHGTLSELSEYFGAKEPLGEFSLCVERPRIDEMERAGGVNVADLVGVLDRLGIATKASAEILATITGDRRSEWYERLTTGLP